MELLLDARVSSRTRRGSVGGDAALRSLFSKPRTALDVAAWLHTFNHAV
jgi:hypothetical protein